ncbi:hypothetical protein ACG2K1_01050 [Neisseria sp. 23W00296]|uniref:hypothetical protein n=1 Tax=unclassified Neisseria TaxID=2623750 RepID=UPI003757578A
MEIEVTVINAAEYRRLKELAAAAQDLSRLFIPKVNIGASCIDANGFAVWNEFEKAVRALGADDEGSV